MKLRALALLCLTVLITQAGAGGMVGNGGDAVLQEFNLRSLQVAGYFKSESTVATQFGIDADKFFEAVRRTKLEGHDKLILEGKEVDAINYPPEMRIEVSRTRWAASATRPDAYFVQRRIALHEMLWIYGINDDNYVVSNPIIALMEKSVGPLTDPDVHRLIMQKLCAAIDREDFATARGYLTWGLDLNQSCGKGPSDMSPMDRLMVSFYWGKETERAALLPMVRALLQYGADPNQYLDRVSATQSAEGVALLFEFGANPNLIDEKFGQSLFAVAASFGPNNALTLNTFRAFLNADGDVNLCGKEFECRSPARAIVVREDNSLVVEELLKSGKSDWCGIAQGFSINRTIDAVRSEYMPLLSKYGVRCPRAKEVFGDERTCELAKSSAQVQCTKDNYKNAILLPKSQKDECVEYWRGKTGEPAEKFFLVKYFCTD